MKTPHFYLKFAFKAQIIESVLLSFEIPTPYSPPFHTSSLRQGQKNLDEQIIKVHLFWRPTPSRKVPKKSVPTA